MCFESFYISLLSSAKQQMNVKLCILEKPEQIFSPIGVLNRFTELRHLTVHVKYKLIFYKALYLPLPSS